MSEPDLLRTPLLKNAVGTKNSDFVIHEYQEDASDLPREGIPLHLHRAEDEGWYVLEGALRFRYGAREFDAPAGSGVMLPRGTPHTFWNPGPKSVRYLLIVGPKTEGLLEALHGPQRPDPSKLRSLYASFDVELLE
jgi:uncharacterized cupin superfamily protein